MPQPEFLTLQDAHPGTNYYIVENAATGRTRARLDSLGLVSGEEIRVLYANFSGFVISIKGSRLALSRGVARGLVIAPFIEGEEYQIERRGGRRQDSQTSQTGQASPASQAGQDRRNADRPDRRDPNRPDRRNADRPDRRASSRPSNDDGLGGIPNDPDNNRKHGCH